MRLEEYDWPELESQFAARMAAFKAVEEGIWEEWREWGEVFKVSWNVNAFFLAELVVNSSIYAWEISHRIRDVYRRHALFCMVFNTWF